jgi:hypothetical protein
MSVEHYSDLMIPRLWELNAGKEQGTALVRQQASYARRPNRFTINYKFGVNVSYWVGIWIGNPNRDACGLTSRDRPAVTSDRQSLHLRSAQTGCQHCVVRIAAAFVRRQRCCCRR